MAEFITIAKEAAEKAGKYLKRKIGQNRIIAQKKGPMDIVTEADIEAQKIIIEIVKKAFPHHGILAEEAKANRFENNEKYTWAIDPIDGTGAYASGLPTYSSSIALLENTKPIVAAIYVAITDKVIWAVKSKGAYCGKKKLAVSSRIDLRETAIGFDPGHYLREEFIKKMIFPLANKIRIMPILCSQATSLALLAAGLLDGYLQGGNPKIWDVAAGKLLVEEAGGIVTDFGGNDLDIFAINGYVAGTSSIHQQLLKFTKK